MAVNALDPTRPLLTDPSIELVQELRAIKQRLVTDKNNIDQLQQTLVNISGITAFGAELLASANADAALSVLDFSTVGKLISQVPSWEDLANELNVVSPIPTLTLGTGKWGISFPGTLKINIVVFDCASGGEDITWAVPFDTSTFGAVGSLFEDNASHPVVTLNHDNAGCRVDHGNASSRNVCVIAIGQ